MYSSRPRRLACPRRVAAPHRRAAGARRWDGPSPASRPRRPARGRVGRCPPSEPEAPSWEDRGRGADGGLPPHGMNTVASRPGVTGEWSSSCCEDPAVPSRADRASATPEAPRKRSARGVRSSTRRPGRQTAGRSRMPSPDRGPSGLAWCVCTMQRVTAAPVQVVYRRWSPAPGTRRPQPGAPRGHVGGPAPRRASSTAHAATMARQTPPVDQPVSRTRGAPGVSEAPWHGGEPGGSGSRESRDVHTTATAPTVRRAAPRPTRHAGRRATRTLGADLRKGPKQGARPA